MWFQIVRVVLDADSTAVDFGCVAVCLLLNEKREPCTAAKYASLNSRISKERITRSRRATPFLPRDTTSDNVRYVSLTRTFLRDRHAIPENVRKSNRCTNSVNSNLTESGKRTPDTFAFAAIALAASGQKSTAVDRRRRQKDTRRASPAESTAVDNAAPFSADNIKSPSGLCF